MRGSSSGVTSCWLDAEEFELDLELEFAVLELTAPVVNDACRASRMDSTLSKRISDNKFRTLN